MPEERAQTDWPKDKKSGVYLDVIAAGFASTHPDAMELIVTRAAAGKPAIEAAAIAESNFGEARACHRFTKSAGTRTGAVARAATSPTPQSSAEGKAYRDANGTLRYSDGSAVGSKSAASLIKMPGTTSTTTTFPTPKE